ncbi:MAG: F-box protein [Gammaproteobacteria bacterium]|nr:F-box protein [Gammaproteobacteria bacterium]
MQENRDLKETSIAPRNDQTPHHRSPQNIENTTFIPDVALPDEIALQILKDLTLKNLTQATQVSKKWHQLTRPTLWQHFINRYTKGDLWRYLFLKPDESSYETYFNEVFPESKVYFPKFEPVFYKVRDEILAGNHLYDPEHYKEIRKAFFGSFKLSDITQTLLQAIEITQILPTEIRQGFVDSYMDTTKSDDIINNIPKIFPILYKINTLDRLSTDYAFVMKFLTSSFRLDQIGIFIGTSKDKKNALLTPKAVITASAYSGSDIIDQIIQEPTLSFLLDRFTEQDLVQCASLSDTTAECILKHPTLINRLSNEDIAKIFCGLSRDPTRNLLYFLVENNPLFLSRLNGQFLTLLTQAKHAAFFILNHPALLQKLNEDECTQIMAKIPLPEDVGATLRNEVFWSFKVKNMSKFLLHFTFSEEVILYDLSASLITPEDALAEALTFTGLALAKAMAKQPILLQKMNRQQFLELAFFHSSVALLLLQNKTVTAKWDDDILGKIERKWHPFPEITEIEKLTAQIRAKLGSPLNQPKNVPNSNSALFFTLISTPRTIPVSPARESYRGISPQRINQPKFIPRRRRFHLPDWPWGSIIFATVLGIIGVVLLASGIGSLCGVGFIVASLTAANALNLSLSTIAAISIFSGLSSSLVSATLFSRIINLFSSKPEPFRPRHVPPAILNPYRYFPKNSGIENHLTIPSNRQFKPTVYKTVVDKPNRKNHQNESHKNELSTPEVEGGPNSSI